MNQKNKIIVKDTWDIKYLREEVFMPFGSLCGVIGQLYQRAGKTADEKEIDKWVRWAFNLACEFVEERYNKIEKGEEEVELPLKK